MTSLPHSPAAILFGSIGTLVDTSSMQLDAFNQAFSELNIPWHWSKDQYVSMLTISGGKKRLRRFAEQRGETVDIDQIHQRKTAIYSEKMKSNGLALRTGVADLISRAKQLDVPVAFVTDTYQQNIDTMFACLHGDVTADDFAWIGSADRVENRKPDAEIFHQALSDLSVNASDAIAIEDTAICLQAALTAGIPTIAFPNAFARDDDMNGAALIVDRLDPDWVSDAPSCLVFAA